MANVESLSAAQIIVVATQLCCKADLEGLQTLQYQRPEVLGAEICCRILLTFVAASEDPSQYVPLLKQLAGGLDDNASRRTIDSSSVEGLTDAEARRRIQQMRFERLRPLEPDDLGADDVITRFVVQQAYRIDSETGDLPAILRLVEPFVHGSQFLQRWLISNLLPLLRLDYEYYSEGSSGLSLAALQDLAGMGGVDRLLQRAKIGEAKSYIGRDLRGIVGPWMCGGRSPKRRKLSPSFRQASIAAQDSNANSGGSGWEEVNQWIIKTSLDDYNLVASAICEWDGPTDIDLGGYGGQAQHLAGESTTLSLKYAQAALATVYATDDASSEAMRNAWRLLERVGDLVRLDRPRQNDANLLPDCSAQPDSITGILPSGLELANLLEPDHALTWPSTESLDFLRAILISVRILRDDLHCQQNPSCRKATSLCLFATKQAQRQELHRTMQNFARVAPVETCWGAVREKTLWLSRWRTRLLSQPQSDEENYRALFWQLSLEDVETEIFTTLLTARRYETAIAQYLADTSSNPLPLFVIEKIVEHELLKAYDNASNGNRTRGGLKRASEILIAFGPHFPSSSPVNKIENLLAATHSLSFYQLTLQHGVPFQPVSIRVHHDPISLISKVLEQNPKAYTKLDDLLSIGRGMVAAGLPTLSPQDNDESTTETMEDDMDSKMLESDHRLTYDAIISALSFNDFDTAYSYILTRLSLPSQPSPSSGPIDDTSWRAAYAAGRHRVPNSASTPLSAQIIALSKRMELLSLALILVPDPSLLPSMLSTWQSCEDKFNTLREREAAEEKAWDDRGDNISSLPGGFGLEDRDIDIAETRREREKRRIGKGGSSVRFKQDEAPIGLFDVARGAALAIKKSAFPLRSAAGEKGVRIAEGDGGEDGAPLSPIKTSNEYPGSRGAGAGAGSGDEGAPHHRLRKRDMVSNMVTGSLVSGLGWVLGAQPADNADGERAELGQRSDG